MVNTYVWFIQDGRKGMQGLSLEERAVYRDVLDLIYFRDGNVPDDDTEIARWIGCDVRIWKRVKATLIARERIHVRDGVVHDSKCDTRLAKEVARGTSQRQKGVLSGIARATAKDLAKRVNKGSKPQLSMAYAEPQLEPQLEPQFEPKKGTAVRTSLSLSKKEYSSFGKNSEHLQPSKELIEHELNTRPRPPGLLATALVDSALARPAASEPEPSEGQASEESTPPIARAPPQPANLEAKFSRAEVGKPQGWDWEPRHAKPHQLAELGADPPQKPPSTQTNLVEKSTNGGFYAAAGSKELKAWQEHYAEIDKGIRLDEAGGWKYPSQWPPGHAA